MTATRPWHAPSVHVLRTAGSAVSGKYPTNDEYSGNINTSGCFVASGPN